MKGITVIICCYNSGNKLLATLKHLAMQQLVDNIFFELIVVDNNCTDQTIDTAKATWTDLSCPFPLSVVQQPVVGLNYARQKGIENARYEYLVLCDDDNWLCEDYLFKVYHLFEAKPEIAVIGGVGEATTNTPIPAWFYTLQGFGYAVGNEGRQTGYVESVYGAGMGLRKQVISTLLNKEFSFLLSDRTGTNLSSGGDTEICILIKKAGYKIYLDSTLTFMHFLSDRRLRWAYYLKLRKSFGRSDAYLQLFYMKQSFASLLYKKTKLKQFLSLSKYAVLHFKYLLFPSLFKNAACANFIQQISMRLVLLTEKKNISNANFTPVEIVKGKPLSHSAGTP